MSEFNTNFNTVGIGDAVPAGTNSLGSGDLFGSSNKASKSKGKKGAKGQTMITSPGPEVERPWIVYAKK